MRSLLAREAAQAAIRNPLEPKPAPLPAKAKSCIFLYMSGGVPQIDTFDYKPSLDKYAGRSIPAMSGVTGEVAAFFRADNTALPSPFPFVQAGKSGRQISSLFPNLSTCVDDLAFIHGIKVDSNNHAPATMHVNTGSVFFGYPSVGAWVTYGLGTQNQNLPGYVVLPDPRGGPVNGTAVWESGFLPACYQGTPLRPSGVPILDLSPPANMSRQQLRRELDLLQRFNEQHLGERTDVDDLESRIAAYELAFRMQMEAPEVVDISKEPEHIRRMYGLDKPETNSFGRQCLLARRMVEKGVRFVLLIHGWENGALSWDMHKELKPRLVSRIGEVDQPVAALLKDLKQRGMFDETLVVWTSEMGRTPFAQGTERPGRNHNQYGLVNWFAGAGIRAGATAGGTDDFGVKAAGDPIPMRDVHATLLRLLGLNDKTLTWLHEGRYKRLTDTGGQVISEILA